MAVADIANSTFQVKQEEEEAVVSSGEFDPVQLEEKILQLCSENPKGVTDEMIIAEHVVNTEQRLRALQRLLSRVSNRLSITVRDTELLVSDIK